MADESSNKPMNLVNIAGHADLAAPIVKLIEVLAQGSGVIYEPTRIVRKAKKPKSFSKRALSFLSTLEKAEAHLFTALCGFILDVQGEPILTVLNWGIQSM
jgi:hypothetical protein